jgi:hypothetical protein
VALVQMPVSEVDVVKEADPKFMQVRRVVEGGGCLSGGLRVCFFFLLPVSEGV